MHFVFAVLMFSVELTYKSAIEVKLNWTVTVVFLDMPHGDIIVFCDVHLGCNDLLNHDSTMELLCVATCFLLLLK